MQSLFKDSLKSAFNVYLIISKETERKITLELAKWFYNNISFRRKGRGSSEIHFMGLS